MPKAKSRAITPGETQNRVWDFEEDPELFEVEVVPDQETNSQGDSDGSPYDQHGERHQPDRAAPRGSGTVSCSRAVSQDECPSIQASLEAGDLSAECVHVNESPYTPESNRERSHLHSPCSEVFPRILPCCPTI